MRDERGGRALCLVLVSSPPRVGLLRFPDFSRSDREEDEPWCELLRKDCSKTLGSRSKFDRIVVPAARGRTGGRCGALGDLAPSSFKAGSIRGERVDNGWESGEVCEANALNAWGMSVRSSWRGGVPSEGEVEEISMRVMAVK